MATKIEEFLKDEYAALKNLPAPKADFRVGDVIKVHQLIQEAVVEKKLSKTAKAIKKAEQGAGAGKTERIQVFEGVVIARNHGREPGSTFTVRKIAAGGIGVEKVFPLYSPTLKKIEVVSRPKVRRAKLYFLRGRIGKAAQKVGLGEAVEAEAEVSSTAEPSESVVQIDSK